MNAHIINLKHRTDRRANMQAQCERLGLNPIFFDAVNGHEKYPDEPRPLMRGHYGCLDSHKMVLEFIFKNCYHPYEYSLVLEDDCLLVDDFTKRLNAKLIMEFSDPDLVFIGGNIHQMTEAVIDRDGDFYKANNVLCTHAYLIKHGSIPKLLTVLNSRQWKVDILFTEFQKIANCLITKECLAWQDVSHSDITGRVNDGTKLKY